MSEAPEPRGLSALDLDVSYRSDRDQLVRDFYTPCMRSAVLYRRAVGYFTSRGLSVAAQGVAHLLHNDGVIQLVASPHLSEEDADHIRSGYEQRAKVVEGAICRSLEDIEDALTRDRLSALAWLISEERLEIKLALPVTPAGHHRRGIYHEKLGIFSDMSDTHVAFVGSSNETEGGLVENFESIDVYTSWDDPQGRVQRKIEQFQRLWTKQTPGLEILDFPDASRELIDKYRSTRRPRHDPGDTEPDDGPAPATDGAPRSPNWLKLHAHQRLARDNWFRNNGRGTFKMATGSGKTIAALAAAAMTFEKAGLVALIVVCPYRHLVTQWAREARKFGLDPILAFESRKRWEPLLHSSMYAVRDGSSPFLSVITTNSTFASEALQDAMGHMPRKTMLVADEVHNLGASDLRTKLPSAIPWRLALSATPERWFDDTGTAAILDYFGRVLEPEYTLRDALDDGVLCPYTYNPILVELTEEELEEYQELSARIAQASRQGGEVDEDDERLKMLLMKRARLMGAARNKLPALRDLMAGRLDTSHTLFYCGDGSVEEDDSDATRRQVESVTELLGSELGYRVASYTYATPTREREELRVRFESGELQGLVAIRCLDEGVDIPVIRRAVILASSANPRQFIQRRGRILRKAEEFGKKHAEIYDMIVVPPPEFEVTDCERSLMRRELSRFMEFAELASNAGEAVGKIVPLQERFGLLDM